jgi:tetratricopeptide (TPR) repeat protein
MRLIDEADRGVIAWTGVVQADYPLRSMTICEVVERVVEQLDPEILAIETRKAIRRQPSNDAYDCVLRATPLVYRFDRDSWRQATDLLDRARAADPQYGRAFAFSAVCRLTGVAQGWSESPGDDIVRIGHDAAAAVACDPHDSLALALSAHIAAFLNHDFPRALALYDRAIRANPSCGFSWGYSALTFAYLGRSDEARERLARAQAFMIHDPYSSFMDAFHTVIDFASRDWPRTIASCRLHLEARPTLHNVRKLLIGALCFAGRLDEARREHDVLAALEADFGWDHYLATYPFGRPQDRTALAAALRKAGLLAAGPTGLAGRAGLRVVNRAVSAEA